MPPEFSVILPTRGVCPFLQDTLASVLRGPSEMELLLVHDRREGEDDLPEELVGDARVRVLHPTTKGVSSARNLALDEARGQWVAFIDDDDVWHPDHLAQTAALLERHPDAILAGSNARVAIVGEAESLDEERIPDLPELLPERSTGPVSLHDLLLQNWFHPSTVLLRRDRLEASDRFDPQMAYMEDYDLWLRLARRADPVFDPRASVVIRKHASNASRNRRGMAQGSLDVLARFLGTGGPRDVLSEHEWRRREGLLWHDLAYACLVDDDAAGARRASVKAIRRCPFLFKNYAYLFASGLPGAMRRAVVLRGRRAT